MLGEGNKTQKKQLKEPNKEHLLEHIGASKTSQKCEHRAKDLLSGCSKDGLIATSLSAKLPEALTLEMWTSTQGKQIIWKAERLEAEEPVWALLGLGLESLMSRQSAKLCWDYQGLGPTGSILSAATWFWKLRILATKTANACRISSFRCVSARLQAQAQHSNFPKKWSKIEGLHHGLHHKHRLKKILSSE